VVESIHLPPQETHAPYFLPQGPAALQGDGNDRDLFCCLGCGKEFAYDWDNMRVIDPEPSRVKILVEKAAQMYAGK
jgi:hypothetical protein